MHSLDTRTGSQHQQRPSYMQLIWCLWMRTSSRHTAVSMKAHRLVQKHVEQGQVCLPLQLG